MGLVIFVIPHLFAVTVVISDQAFATASEQCSLDPANTLVQRFDCSDSCFILACVPNHIAVGKVYDDEVIVAGLNRLYQ